MPIAIDIEACTGCEVCDDVCPMDVISMDDIDGKYVAYMKYPEECVHCKACVMDCPSSCISLDFSIMYRDGVPVDMTASIQPHPPKDIALRKWRGVAVDVIAPDSRWSRDREVV